MQYLLSLSVFAAALVSALPSPQLSAPDGYWVAEIWKNGCKSTENTQDNPRYSFAQQDALPCTSVTGYGYQSASFNDNAGSKWALNVYTDADCTVPLTEGFTGDGCITSPEGQFVVAVSVTPR